MTCCGLGKRVYADTEQMKQAFDPLCILNCDKIVRMQQPQKGEVQPW